MWSMRSPSISRSTAGPQLTVGQHGTSRTDGTAGEAWVVSSESVLIDASNVKRGCTARTDERQSVKSISEEIKYPCYM
jgi:hypothetical protein